MVHNHVVDNGVAGVRMTASGDSLSQAFAALADPTRRELVVRLAVGDATVGQLAAPFTMSQQAISKHLSVLERAGLVTKTKEAQRTSVRLEAEVFDLMTKWIERYQRQVEERYQRLDAVLDEMNADERSASEPARTTTRTSTRRERAS
jgi:DNA-binding transcriptional ArsR family regulator